MTELFCPPARFSADTGHWTRLLAPGRYTTTRQWLAGDRALRGQRQKRRRGLLFGGHSEAVNDYLERTYIEQLTGIPKSVSRQPWFSIRHLVP